MSSVQQIDVGTAGPKAPESVYLSKVANKTSPQVSYSSDIAADWSTGEKVNKAKGKASVAGSLYYTASDSGSQSAEDSVYEAVSLPDSDKDFQIKVGVASKAASLPVIETGLYQSLTTLYTSCIAFKSLRSKAFIPVYASIRLCASHRWEHDRTGAGRGCSCGTVSGSWSCKHKCSSY